VFSNGQKRASVTSPGNAYGGRDAFAGTAFYNAKPDGMVYLGATAYEYKGAMPANTDIVIANGVKYIRGYLFYQEPNLRSISIPDSVTSIEGYTFYDCVNLVSVRLPAALTEISGMLFRGCAKLSDLNIPDTVHKIGAFAFMMLNIPLLTVTVTFGMSMVLKARTSTEVYKAQLDMQVQHYEFMARMNDDLRMFRHDFPKKMRPLIAYLDENNVAEARSIAEQFVDFMSNQGERIRTGNYRLDTVLFCEQQTARKDGIRIVFTNESRFPAEGIAPDDIYTIFPNALDNAIEACRKVEGEKVITLRTRMDRQTVFVTIRNPVAGEVRQRGGMLQTTKEDKNQHGYGFKSIKKAAARYGSDNVSFTVENGVFELRIFLQYASPGEKQT
jgi:hypothetical protein